MLNRIRPYVAQHFRRSFLQRYYDTNFRFSRPRIIGRHACLGAEVLGLFEGARSVNFQKNRVDHILDFPTSGKSSNNGVPLRIINNIIENWPIRACLQRQSNDLFSLRDADLVVIDSFSELADQKFRYAGKQLYCCYTDLALDARCSSDLECDGLIDLASLSGYYDRFFSRLNECSPNCKLIFLHFPMIKETRGKFIQRGDEIRKAVEGLVDKYDNLYSYSIENALAKKLNQGDSDPFTYHYHAEIYNEFASKIFKDISHLHLKQGNK